MQRSALAIGLCFLAFLFAFEAKLTWYNPSSDLGGQVSATKALRSDAPRLVSHGAAMSAGAHTTAAFIALALLIAIYLSAGESSGKFLLLSSNPFASLPFYLLAPVEFRPPPAR
jgi:hypothetical protein